MTKPADDQPGRMQRDRFRRRTAGIQIAAVIHLDSQRMGHVFIAHRVVDLESGHAVDIARGESRVVHRMLDGLARHRQSRPVGGLHKRRAANSNDAYLVGQ
jgi:hypothetical protein